MKKILLSGAFAALALGAMADSLTPQQALARVYSEGASLGLRYAPASDARLVDTAKLDGVNTYYVFSDDNQTMIVSADDVAMPLLGSFDSSVTDMDAIPANMKWWLGEYSRRIAWAARQQTDTNYFYGKLQKQDVREATYRDVAAMITTEWNQDAPYNNLTPRINGKATYTGCVATAMAQVMNYFEWPQGAGAGTGSVEVNGETLTMNFAQTTFDWANMLNKYTNSATATQKNAVAVLMKACGYSVNMNYGTDASGAQSSALVGALINNFGYDGGIHYDHRDFYSYDEWVDKLYAEMAAGRPVLYGGSSDSGGHQFVFDGFRASDKAFHVNWGWGGYCDGYFLVDALNPDGQGIGGNDGEGYNSGQDAVLGICRPQGGQAEQSAYIMYYNGSSLAASLTNGTITFQLDGGQGYFANLSGIDATVTFGTRLVNAETGAVMGVYDNSSVNNYALNSGGGFSQYRVRGIPTLANGVYDFYTIYRIGTGEWQNMRAPYGTNCFARMEVTNGVAEQVSGYAELVATNYAGPETAEAGKEISFTFDIANIGKSAAPTQVTAYLCSVNSEGGLAIEAQIGKPVMTDIAVGQTAKAVKFSGYVADDIASGSYYLVLCDNDLWILNAEDCLPEIEVTGGTDVVITSISSYNNTELVAGERCRINVGVKNNGSKTVSVQLIGKMIDASGADIIGIIGQSSARNVAANATVTFSITGTVPAVTPAGKNIIGIFDAVTNNLMGAAWVDVKGSGAIEDVAADGSEADAVYYDLNGRKADANAKGILIKRTASSKAVKVAR